MIYLIFILYLNPCAFCDKTFNLQYYLLEIIGAEKDEANNELKFIFFSSIGITDGFNNND